MFDQAKPIIFFDGECNLCNGFVDLMLKIDPDQKFYLAPLQGRTAQQYLPPLPENPEDWAITYFDGVNTYYASDACLAICQRLGGPWQLLTLARPLPQNFRDWLYRLVATNRYRWFGQRTCRTMDLTKPSPFLP
ncbi:thiol-disulfide oxidoreductase DCC family protein [Picosynechococcus sp. PCC 8807]|uniref:thiol-disulfide oxidoreductase DCC family protein n=1 Tax=Picosynechococcus sp. PCC 8807 TaxID=195248 RepID=UPI000810E797|nr:DCC1-like thiol-disulfide oxidoreductase family protein [Picosynechococcus sp. PCC 8807]ANV91401.1 thiol-disulfide oxidoreductase DCC [Picosynechococcus sp. PCC 8807]